MTQADLLPGDILLYRTPSFIGWAIRKFDSSEHNHAAIWDGIQVIEMESRGVIGGSLAESVGPSKVDVYRVSSLRFDSDDAARKSIKYLAQGNRYAYGQILLLAPLVRLRKCRYPAIARWIRRWTDKCAEKLIAAHDGDRQPMICSELVYRCYEQRITIKEIDAAEPDLVTPGDLEESPDLKLIGRIA